MGQYFDFGDQVGPLLSEAFNRLERKQQFTAQQAMDYLRIQEAQNQFKATLKVSQDQLAESKRKNRADIINDITDNYVPADAITAATGKTPAQLGLKGKTFQEITAPYGEDFGFNPKEIAYDVKSFAGAVERLKEQVRMAKLESELEKAQPKTVTHGLTDIPTKNIESAVSQEITIPYRPSVENTKAFSQFRRPALSGDQLTEFIKSDVARRFPTIDISGKALHYDAEKGTLRITPIDDGGLPVPSVPGEKHFAPADVRRFFEGDGVNPSPYSLIKSQYDKMSPLDKQRDLSTILSIGEALTEMTEAFPEYAQKAKPFEFATRLYNEQRLLKSAMESQRQQNYEQSQGSMLLRSVANKSPQVAEELERRAMKVLNQEKLMRQQPNSQNFGF